MFIKIHDFWKSVSGSSEQDVNFGSPESPPHKRRKRILEELETEDEDSGNEYEPGINYEMMFWELLSIFNNSW